MTIRTETPPEAPVRSGRVNRLVLPIAAVLTIGLASLGALGQPAARAAAAPVASSLATRGHHSRPHRTGHLRSKRIIRARARHSFASWRVWCKQHTSCVRRYSWTARGNPVVRHAKWRAWCLAHLVCLKANGWLQPRYVLTGPVGAEISRLPEGAYVATFMAAARAYGVSPEILMGIGIVESGGGTAGTAYEGCMNYATFGSWPGQIYCAAGVLARVGLAGYNAVNPSYSSVVMGQAAGIGIVTV